MGESKGATVPVLLLLCGKLYIWAWLMLWPCGAERGMPLLWP